MQFNAKILQVVSHFFRKQILMFNYVSEENFLYLVNTCSTYCIQKSKA